MEQLFNFGLAHLVRAASDEFAECLGYDDLLLVSIAAQLAEIMYRPHEIQGMFQQLGYEKLGYAQEEATWLLTRICIAGEVSFAVVFRGTADAKDAFNNLLVKPMTSEHSPDSFHGGFLKSVHPTGNPLLYQCLQRHVRGVVPLYLIGHSLGGAQALTLLGSGLLPTSHVGTKIVVMFGSPKVFYSKVSSAFSRLDATVFLVVNDMDIVPRVLGSSSVLVTNLVSRCFGDKSPQARASHSILDTLENYKHPEGLKLVVLRDRKALQPQRDLHDSVWLDLESSGCMTNYRKAVSDHLMASYIQSLGAIDLSILGRQGLLKDLEALSHAVGTASKVCTQLPHLYAEDSDQDSDHQDFEHEEMEQENKSYDDGITDMVFQDHHYVYEPQFNMPKQTQQFSTSTYFSLVVSLLVVCVAVASGTGWMCMPSFSSFVTGSVPHSTGTASTSVSKPPPTFQDLAEKARFVSTQLGLDPSLPMIQTLNEASKILGIELVGTTGAKFERLVMELSPTDVNYKADQPQPAQSTQTSNDG